MFHLKSRLKLFSVLLTIVMLLSVFVACGKQGEENTVTKPDSKQERGSTAQQPGKDKAGEQTSGEEITKNPKTIFPELEEQTIYDQDGIQIIASTFSGYYNPKHPDVIAECKVVNHTDKMINASFIGLQSAAGIYFNTYNQLVGIGAHEEHKTAVHIMPSVFEPLVGRDDFYRDYGLGEKIGDYKLKVLVMDAESNEHLRVFFTETIKTKTSGVKPDLTQVHSKTKFLDQEGIKVYFVDAFFSAAVEDAYFSEDTYLAVLYYENTTDIDVTLNYEDVVINGEETTGGFYFGGSDFPPQSQGFAVIQLTKDDLEEEGFKEWKSLTFTGWGLGFKEVNGNKEDAINFRTEKPITLDFPQPWPVKGE